MNPSEVEDLPYWVNLKWDQIHSLEPYTHKIEGWVRDGGNYGVILIGPFVVEQISPTSNTKLQWLPSLHSNLGIMDDRQNSIHEIHFDSSFKDHIGRVTGSIRWEKGQIIADTDTFGKIAIRRLQESDRKLFGNDAPPENSSVMAMAKFFFGEED